MVFRPIDYFYAGGDISHPNVIRDRDHESRRRIDERRALDSETGVEPSSGLGRRALDGVQIGDGDNEQLPVKHHPVVDTVLEYVDSATDRAEARRRLAELRLALAVLEEQINQNTTTRNADVPDESYSPPPVPEIIHHTRSERNGDQWAKVVRLEDLVECTDHLSDEELETYNASDKHTQEAILLAKYAEGFGLVAVVETSVDRVLYGDESVDRVYGELRQEYRDRVVRSGDFGRDHSFSSLEYRVAQDQESELLRQAGRGSRRPGPSLVEMERLDGYITEDQDSVRITFNRLFIDLCDKERARQKQFWNTRPQLRRVLEENRPDLLPTPGHTFDYVLVDRIKSEFVAGKHIKFAIPPAEMWRPWVQGLRDAYLEYIVKTGDRTCMFSLVDRDGTGSVLERFSAPLSSDYLATDTERIAVLA